AAAAAPGSPSSPRADLSRSSVPSFAKEGRIVEGNNMVWGENAGWVNLKARNGNLRIGSNVLAGWVWFENIGWVCVGNGKPLDGKRYSNRRVDDWGINNDGKGNLSGFAWSEVAGWINFSASHARVHLDEKGRFCGYAWGENVGWIKFGPGGRVKYLAKATPGPWKEIGVETEGRFAGNGCSGESYVRSDHIPPSGLTRNSKRYDENAGILCMGMVDEDVYYGYVRHDDKPVCKPVCIEFGRESDYIRGPPVI
ncbi:MAG: hypothetical protein P8123_11485, partial [bacterium]